ncbi:MAG: beta strand repeat-containing protein, partial [Planctomycetaceae bacterium]
MSMAGPANQQSFTPGDITSGPFSTTVWTRNNLLMDTVIPGPTLVTGQLVLNATGLTLPPPGLPTNIGAALPVTGNFSANFTFYANGTPYKQYYNALNTGGAGTVGNFQGQFWYENSPIFSASSLTAGLSNNGIADTFVISKVGSDTVLTINGLTAYRFPTANLSTITINGSNDQDSLTIDYSNGNPLPASGVNFNGGSGFDTLSFIGGGSFANITHNFSNANDGSVNIDGTVVAYTGLDPVIDNLNAATRSFIFNGGAETITLADSGTPGQTLISSTLGESVTFVNPTSSLTVNPGSGSDTVNVTGLGSGFVADLNILGAVSGGLSELGNFAYTNNGLGQPGDSLDVNPNGETVYIGGSFGPSYAAFLRVQAVNPGTMFADLGGLGQGGGIAVNPVTGRFAVTNGSNQLTVYNANGTVYDTKTLNGLGGSIAAGNGTFGISTQGSDSFHLYNEAAKTIQIFSGLAVGSRVTYNPATAFYYMNRTPGQTFFVNEANPAVNGVLGSSIFFEAASSTTGRLYAANGTSVNIYNGNIPTAPPLVGVISGLPASVQDIAVDTVHDLVYVGLSGTNTIRIYSGDGSTFLGTYSLPAGNFVQKLDIASGSERLYVSAFLGGTSSKLFVLSADGDTVNINGVTSTAGAVQITGEDVNINANLTAGGNIQVTAESIDFGNGTLSTGAGNSATLNAGLGSILSGTTATDVIAGTISLVAGAGGIGASGNPLTLSGTNLNSTTSGNGNQFFSTSGALTIDATGLSAGTGTIQLDAGTFTLGGSNRINDNSKLNVNSATFTIGNNSETIDTLTLTSGSVTGSAGVLTSTNTIQTQTGLISASLAGTNGLTQSTGGTTTLTGTNSYTGTTNINAGTLLVNGTNSGTGAVNVNNTGTLGGNGSIGGTVTAASGSIVAPGSSAAVGTVGTLTVGGLILNNGSTLQVDLTNTPTSDKIIVTGSTLTLTNPTIAPTAPGNLTNSSNQNFRIIQSGTAATGTFNSLPEGSQVAVAGSSVPSYVTYQGGTSSLPGTNVDLNTQPTINGTSSSDTLVFNTTATGYTYSLNSGAAVAVNANIPFIFNGGDGDDVMQVNLNTFTLPTAGVFFNGNNQDLTVPAPTPNAGDVLKVVGNGANVEYRAFGTPGTTNKNLNVNTSVGLITATGVEPGDLSGFATVDVVFSGANEVLSIDNGFDATTGLIPALVVTGTTGGNPFEGAHLWNNTQVRILTANTLIGGTDGNDSVVINSASNAHNNANLWIDTGSGTDSVTVAGNATVSGSITILSQNISFTGGSASASAVVLNAGTGAITTTTNAVDVSAAQLTAQATTG